MSLTRKLSAALGALIALTALTSCSQGDIGGAASLPQAPPAASFTSDDAAMTAPQITGRLLDGTEINLADLWRERVLIVHFTSSWCTQCVAAEAELASISEEFDGAVLPVHIAFQENNDEFSSYLRESGAVGPALIDTTGSIWRDYAISEPPVIAVIDTQGKLVRMWPGELNSDKLRETLHSLITLD